jgi:hypothetical protein
MWSVSLAGNVIGILVAVRRFDCFELPTRLLRCSASGVAELGSDTHSAQRSRFRHQPVSEWGSDTNSAGYAANVK